LVDRAIYRRPAIEVAAKYSELGSLMVAAGAVGLISHHHRSLTSDTLILARGTASARAAAPGGR
jgi:hypothetical protein